MATPAEVPAELAELDQWVVTKLVHGFDQHGNPKTDKPPFRLSKDGRRLIKCSHSKPSDWTTYQEACRIVAEGIDGAQAVSFVLSDNVPYTGIDLDGCRNPETGDIDEWAVPTVKRFYRRGYAEVSQSETGIKFIVRGKVARSIKWVFGPHKGIEVYATERHFWLTGNHFGEMPAVIGDSQVELDALLTELEQRTAKPKPAPKPAARPTTKRSGESRLDEWKRANELPDLFHKHGAPLVRDNGDELLFGGFPGDKHSHAVTYKVSRSIKYGWIGISYSPSGKLNNSDYPRGFTNYDAAVAIEHGGNEEAFKAQFRTQPRQQPEEPPHPAEAPRTTTTPTQRAAEAARKRQARQSAAAELRAEVEARAAADDTLSPADRAVLNVLLTIAGERGWCRPSKERIAEMSGYSLGSVKRALGRLEGRYIRSEGDGGGPNSTAVRTFLRGSSAAPAEPEMIHECTRTCDLETNQELVSGGATPSAPEAEYPSAPDEPLADAPAELPYALALAVELSGPVPELEALNEGELRAWIEQAERALAAPLPDTEALHGPDGAIAYPDGAAYLPTAAAQAWWEALPKTPRPVPEVVTLPEPTPVPARRKVEPADPDLRSRYYGLTGKARKARAAGNGRQASALERQAAEMLTRCATRYVDETAPKVTTGARAAPTHKRGSKPAQSVLFGP